jgi:hypothetical protein
MDGLAGVAYSWPGWEAEVEAMALMRRCRPRRLERLSHSETRAIDRPGGRRERQSPFGDVRFGYSTTRSDLL